MGGLRGAAYSLPRKNFTPPLPIVEEAEGVKYFSDGGVRSPPETPPTRVAPNCPGLPENVKKRL